LLHLVEQQRIPHVRWLCGVARTDDADGVSRAVRGDPLVLRVGAHAHGGRRAGHVGAPVMV